MSNRYKEIVDKHGKEYIYEQLAEECCELAQACLKLIRVAKKTTPMRMDEAWERFLEELADVSLMMDMAADVFLPERDLDNIAGIMERKEQRMYERLLDGKMDEDVF